MIVLLHGSWLTSQKLIQIQNQFRNGIPELVLNLQERINSCHEQSIKQPVVSTAVRWPLEVTMNQHLTAAGTPQWKPHKPSQLLLAAYSCPLVLVQLTGSSVALVARSVPAVLVILLD